MQNNWTPRSWTDQGKFYVIYLTLVLAVVGIVVWLAKARLL